MAYFKSYICGIDDLIQKETGRLYHEYGLPKNVLNRVRTFYGYQPSSLGNASKVVDFLAGIFDDYNYSKEDFSTFLGTYADLVCCNPVELERRIVILNAQGLMETVLFEKPYVLLNNHRLSSLNLYAVGKNLKNDGIELTYDNVYGIDYTNCQLEKLRKLYPLKVSKYDVYQKLFEKKREKLRSQNETLLSLKKED